MTIAFTDIPVPALGAQADPLFERAVQLDYDYTVDRYGDDDLTQDAASIAADLREQRYAEKAFVAAEDGDDLIGTLRLEFPTTDNTEVAEWSVTLAPDAPDAAWGALFDRISELALERGRTVLQGWTSHPLTDSGEVVRPLTGSGYLGHDAAAAALAARGHVLEQVERHSMLDLDEGDIVADLARSAAATAGPDYDPVTWVGRTPERWVDSMARLRARMSVDVPTAGLESEERAWDADRVRAMDAVHAERGGSYLMAVIRHVPTDELVAYSAIDQSASHPAAGWQGDTLVHGEHRGHRLGMLVKCANLTSAAVRSPELRRIHTWNAGENAHMLAINAALGFRLRTVEGIWQLRLS